MAIMVVLVRRVSNHDLMQRRFRYHSSLNSQGSEHPGQRSPIEQASLFTKK